MIVLFVQRNNPPQMLLLAILEKTRKSILVDVASRCIRKSRKCCFFCPPRRQHIRQHWQCCSKCCSFCPPRRQQILSFDAAHHISNNSLTGRIPRPYQTATPHLLRVPVRIKQRDLLKELDVIAICRIAFCKCGDLACDRAAGDIYECFHRAE